MEHDAKGSWALSNCYVSTIYSSKAVVNSAGALVQYSSYVVPYRTNLLLSKTSIIVWQALTVCVSLSEIGTIECAARAWMMRSISTRRC
jgi:hypothetical protein